MSGLEPTAAKVILILRHQSKPHDHESRFYVLFSLQLRLGKILIRLPNPTCVSACDTRLCTYFTEVLHVFFSHFFQASLVVFVLYSSTHKALGKIEVLPLPQEEQACFDKERVHGDLSRVIGHMVLEKCVYATEMLKKHFDTSKFSEPTVKWFKGLIEQTVHEGQRFPAPDFSHYNIRGKRQAQQDVRFGTQQRAPFAPQQWAQVAAQPGAQQGVPFGTPQEIPFGTPQEIPFGTPPGQSEIPQNVIGTQEQPYFRIRKEYRMLSDMERNLFHRAFQMLKADTVSMW